MIPNNYLQLQARVKNYSQNIFRDTQLEIIYDDGERKILNGKNLSPNDEIIFDVPMNQKIIHGSKYVIKLNFFGDGAEIRGSSCEYDLILKE